MKSNWDLVGLSAIGITYLLTFSTPLRVPLGIIFLLYLPGYALTTAIFPGRDAITPIERQGIAVGLSIATLPIQAIVLRYLQFPFSLASIIGSVSTITGLAIAYTAWKRTQLGEQAYRPNAPSRNQTFGVIFSLIVLTSFAAAIISIDQPETFTEFYLGGEDVNVSQIFRTASLNEALSVNLVVVNQEQQTQTYYYELWVEDSWTDQTERLIQSEPFQLAADTTQSRPVAFQMPKTGSDQQVHFYLFRMGDDSPYRQLTLWIDVTENKASQ